MNYCLNYKRKLALELAHRVYEYASNHMTLEEIEILNMLDLNSPILKIFQDACVSTSVRDEVLHNIKSSELKRANKLNFSKIHSIIKDLVDEYGEDIESSYDAIIYLRR